VRREKDFQTEMETAFAFINDDCYGIEIDLDAIPGIASSAMTISGFSVEEARRFVSFFGNSPNAAYLHICEGAPALGDEKNPNLIGKVIGYLITDFIKSHHQKPEKVDLEVASNKDCSK
jgi:formiminoglutamase